KNDKLGDLQCCAGANKSPKRPSGGGREQVTSALKHSFSSKPQERRVNWGLCLQTEVPNDVVTCSSGVRPHLLIRRRGKQATLFLSIVSADI
ncbi:hypothetical protein CEXT_573771, partial [Caerostris extrusa]